MPNPQTASADDVQQDLLQRTRRWLDILEARTLALLAAIDPDTLTPAEREASINRYLQLTTRFFQLRQRASKTPNPRPDYNAWLDQILSDPQPGHLPQFDPHCLPGESATSATLPGKAELEAEVSRPRLPSHPHNNA